MNYLFRTVSLFIPLVFSMATVAGDATLELAQKTFQQADALAESGDLSGAKLRFESTLEILERVRAKAPDNVDVNALYAETLLMTGSLCVDLEQKAQAKMLFEEAIAIYDDLSRRDTTDIRWIRGGSVAREVLQNIDNF